MSQKKVDLYKEEKANRDKLMKRDRRNAMIEKLAAILIGLAIVCWLGYSGYTKIQESQAETVTETVINTTAIDDYMESLSAEE